MSANNNLDLLVKNAKQFDKDALSTLYDIFLPSIFRYIYYQVNNRVIAEDLTSETFLKMLKAIKNFREDGSSFYPWLLRIAKNTTFDYLRSKAKQVHVPIDDGIDEQIFDKQTIVDIEHKVLQNLDAEEVKSAISKLTDDQQQVILLKFTMGLANAEVAKVLDKTEGSIKSLQVRALASLKRILENQAREMTRESKFEPKVEPVLSAEAKEAYNEA